MKDNFKGHFIAVPKFFNKFLFDIEAVQTLIEDKQVTALTENIDTSYFKLIEQNQEATVFSAIVYFKSQNRISD